MSEQGAAPVPTPQPLVINVQYIKDLSFELPGAPAIFAQLRTPPNVGVNLDVQVQRLEEGGNVFEVALAIRAEGTAAPANTAGGTEEKPPVVFIADIVYAGVFTLNNVPENQHEPILLVECPRLLFPWARNILADITRDAGIPPVLLGTIDFVGLWQQRRAAAFAASATTGGAVNGAPN